MQETIVAMVAKMPEAILTKYGLLTCEIMNASILQAMNYLYLTAVCAAVNVWLRLCTIFPILCRRAHLSIQSDRL